MSPGILRQLWVKPQAEMPLRDSSQMLSDLSQPIYIFEKAGQTYLTNRVELSLTENTDFCRLLAFDGEANVARVGSDEFLKQHHLKLPYLTGGMAHGIASVEMVVALGKAGLLGFFGTGGLTLGEVEKAIVQIQTELTCGESYGVNMISLGPDHDQKSIDLFLRLGVSRIEVAGAITLSPALIEYRLKGAYHNDAGQVIVPNKIFAKFSREEVATLFMSPPPEKIVRQILQTGKISTAEAEIAGSIPMAEDVIAEADSGGHTDNRPALLLFQNMVNIRDQLQEKYQYANKIRVGAAGGISTPYTVLAAFTLGADFVVTGSINQSCLEANTSAMVKQMLSQVSMSDVANAPSADMFEMGSKVQVLAKGVMFHLKGNKLYELYQNCKSIEEIPDKIREQLEGRTFRDSLNNIWASTKAYFQERSPEIITRAEQNPKFKMALIFRWYLGLATSWAQKGDVERKVDFQIFCGPSMGAFNRWVKGTYLENPENRKVVDVALNLMEGALYLRRIQFLKEQGIKFGSDLSRIIPKRRR